MLYARPSPVTKALGDGAAGCCSGPPVSTVDSRLAECPLIDPLCVPSLPAAPGVLAVPFASCCPSRLPVGTRMDAAHPLRLLLCDEPLGD